MGTPTTNASDAFHGIAEFTTAQKAELDAIEAATGTATTATKTELINAIKRVRGEITDTQTGVKEKAKEQAVRDSAAKTEAIVKAIDPTNPLSVIDRTALQGQLNAEAAIIGNDKKVENAIVTVKANITEHLKNELVNSSAGTTSGLNDARATLDIYVKNKLITPDERETILATAANAVNTKVTELLTQVGSTMTEAEAIAVARTIANVDVRTRLEQKLKEKALTQPKVKSALDKAKPILRSRIQMRGVGGALTAADIQTVVPEWNQFSPSEQAAIQEQLETTYKDDSDILNRATRFRNTIEGKTAENIFSALERDIDTIPMPTAEYRSALKQGLVSLREIEKAHNNVTAEQNELLRLQSGKKNREITILRVKRITKFAIAGAILGAGGGTLLGGGGGTLLGSIGGAIGGAYLNDRIKLFYPLQLQQAKIDRAAIEEEMTELGLKKATRLLERGAKGTEVAIEVLTTATGRARDEVKTLLETYTGTGNYANLLNTLRQSGPVNYARAA
jgi:hypothetical protein